LGPFADEAGGPFFLREDSGDAGGVVTVAGQNASPSQPTHAASLA
jgi:hypothetical protein